MNKSKLLFNSFIIVIAGAVTAYFIFVTLSQRSLLNENFQKQHQLDQQIQAQSVTSNLTGKVGATVEKLQLLAEIQEVKTGNQEVCSAKLAEVFDTFSSEFLDTLSRMGSDGIFDCSISESTPGYDGRQLPHLVEILDDPEHRPVMGPAVISTDERLFTSIHVPIFDEGKFNGTIGTAIYFDELAKEFVFSQNIDQDTVETVIIDDTGKVIAHNESDELGEPYQSDVDSLNNAVRQFKAGELKEKTISYSADDSTHTYSVFMPMPGTSWMLILSSETGQFDDSTPGITSGFVGDIGVMIGALVAVVVAAVAIVLYYTNRNIFSPFITIKRTVDQIGSGELDERIDTEEVGSYSEFVKISEAINSMADKLEESYQKLGEKASIEEQKANRASGDLEKKLEELERINKLMIGREEKMIEMKKRIAELEKGKSKST